MTAKVLIKSDATCFLPESYATQDRKTLSTINHIITRIRHDGFLHLFGVEQVYIGDCLRDTLTCLNEYIKQTTGSLLGFLQDSAHEQEL